MGAPGVVGWELLEWWGGSSWSGGVGAPGVVGWELLEL